MLLRVCLFAVIGALAHAANETFVLLDSRGKLTASDPERARTALSPCSTFKIPNSLISLDSRVASDLAFTLPYDPKRDGVQYGAWNRDLDLRSALRESAAWYYREMARRVGPQQMQAYLDRFDYGNRSTAPAVDKFWIGGGLRITAEEQVRFLERFRENRLGISPAIGNAVRDALLLETGKAYRWYGKTGTCTDVDHGPVAWHVGFVERGADVTYYALNFGGASVAEVFRRRPALIRGRLSQAGLIDADPPDALEQMTARIAAAIAAFPGEVSLYAKNIDSGKDFGIHPDERVRTASTIKLPIMAAAFSAVAQGRINWENTVELRAEDKVSGSGVLHEFSPGTRHPIRDLINLMIVVSDNTATNLVIDQITADFVNAELDKLGLTQTRSLRKIMSGDKTSGHSREGKLEEFRRFGLGVSTPREMVALLEKLARREVVSPEASREMLWILGRQQFKDGIGRRLPSNIVASKSGSLDRLRSDVGLVQSTGGRIAIAITVDDMLRTDYSPENAGQVLISELTGMLLDGLASPVSNLGEPESTIELKASMDHVQGIEVDGERLWVTWVDRTKKTGHLGEFELKTGKLLRQVEIHSSVQYHPGGLAAEGDSLWIPVAEYKRDGTSQVQRRSKRTLEIEAQFDVPDHIGAIAASGGKLYGANWDAVRLYTWDRTGKQLAVRDNPAGTRYQDMKFAGEHLVAAGLRGNEGAIDWLGPVDFHLVKRMRVGKTSTGVVLTHEGMAISGDRLYLLPEDAPSRLFTFQLVQ